MIIVYTILSFLFFANAILFYRLIRTEKALREEIEKSNRSLADAGNAIADTLKVAFDGIKRLTTKQDKQVNENNQIIGRIHRIEQQLQRMKYSEEASKQTSLEETKNERRKSKTN